MRQSLTFLIFLSLGLVTSVWASGTERYLESGKVVFEAPQQEDVLKVKLSYGFLTVLEFPQKPIMVAVGDDTLLAVEVPNNSKNVVLKPLLDSGVTNLFVFTPQKRFNYQVVIGRPDESDYVVDVNESQEVLPGDNPLREVDLVDLIKMTNNYSVLKELGNINDRVLQRKRLYQLCDHPKVNLSIIDLFKYNDPHYLIVHFSIRNASDRPMKLKEENTSLLSSGQKFIPQYIFFDKDQLDSGEKTNGWMFLKDSYLALDNHFQIALGVNDEIYQCQ